MNTSFKSGFTPIGLDNPAEVMAAFQETGNEMLVKLRSLINNPHSQKKPRTWGIVEAAKLIGISAPTLRKLETKEGKLGAPIYDEFKRRTYTLKRINEIRDILGTRYKRPKESKAIKCCIVNFKGGSAKTTTTTHLGPKCAMEGLRTLLIDFDPQGSSTFVCGCIVPDLELDYEDTIYETLINKSDDIRRIIRKTNFNGLDIIPANLALQDLELALPNSNINNVSSMGAPAKRLLSALKHIENDYDVILIDCGPNLGVLTINAIIACNALLVPIPPNMFDYASFIMLTGTLKRLFNSLQDKSFDFFRILITKHSGSNEAMQVENMIRTQFSGYVLANHMCSTVEIEKSTNDLRTIYETTKLRGSKEAYRRALHHLESVNNEIISYFKQIWESNPPKESNDLVQYTNSMELTNE